MKSGIIQSCMKDENEYEKQIAVTFFFKEEKGHATLNLTPPNNGC